MPFESIQFCGSTSGEIIQRTFEKPDLAADDVAISVTHSGLCGTDCHFTGLNMVLGHEGVGIVKSIGSAVTTVKVGDRVGWGYVNWTCGECEFCISGEDNFCSKRRLYAEEDQDDGTLSSIAVRKEKWLIRVPEKMRSEDAAPMMCGGASVWQPLVEHVRPYDRVGIVGIGGLGHIAIQLAARMGTDVVVFSSTESKRDEVLRLGAKEFHVITDNNYAALKLSKSIDRLLLCASVDLELGMFFPILSAKAIVFPLAVSAGQITAPNMPTITRGIKIVGTASATRFMLNKLLEFAARNDVHVITEDFPMTVEGVREAMAKLREGKMRYRAVISWK